MKSFPKGISSTRLPKAAQILYASSSGKDARVYLGSSELAAVTALLGKIPTLAEYQEIVSSVLSENTDEIYKYLNFHLMDKISLS